jgi:hypothetical protein
VGRIGDITKVGGFDVNGQANFTVPINQLCYISLTNEKGAPLTIEVNG